MKKQNERKTYRKVNELTDERIINKQSKSTDRGKQKQTKHKIK